MGEGYRPEVVQWISGTRWEPIAMDDTEISIMMGLFRDISRAFWNRRQEPWCESRWGEETTVYDVGNRDPGIPGITFREFVYGDDDPTPELPNFSFGGVEIRWYKYPGRGTSVNKRMTPAEWFSWARECRDAIDAYEHTCLRCGRKAERFDMFSEACLLKRCCTPTP